MKFRPIIAAALFAVFMANVPASASVVLFSQPFNGDALNLYASQNDPLEYNDFATTYDNFTLGSDSEITEVSWVGGFFNGTPLPITNFDVSFYANDSGQPGSLLSSYSFSGDANPVDNGDGTNTYSVILGTSFLASAGSTYWVSFVPTLDFPPQWGWGTSNVGDKLSFQDFFGTRSELAFDFAFEVRGNVVPEPGSWALAAIGIGSVLTFRTRRRVIS